MNNAPPGGFRGYTGPSSRFDSEPKVETIGPVQFSAGIMFRLRRTVWPAVSDWTLQIFIDGYDKAAPSDEHRRIESKIGIMAIDMAEWSNSITYPLTELRK